MKRPTLSLALVVALCLLASAQQAERPAKRTLQPDDYAQWETLAGFSISPDGHWFACGINRVDQDEYAIVRNCDSPERKQIPLASNPRFSDDSKWCAYTIVVARAEAEKLREQRKPVENGLGLIELATGREIRMESVQSWTFTKGGGFLVAHKHRAQSRAAGGSDLVVTNLRDLSTVTVGNVANYAVHSEGKLVAVSLDSGGEEKGVQVLVLESGTIRNVYFAKASFSNLQWARDAEVLAFLFGTKDESKEGDWYSVVRATNTHTPSPTLQIYDPKEHEDFPKGYRISEFGGLSLNDDGSVFAFGIKEWEDKKKPEGRPEDKPNVDVWHWRDVDPQPYQLRRVEQEKRRTYLCLWEPERRAFKRVGNEQVKQVSLLKGFRKAIWQDDSPYRSSVAVGGLTYSDWHVLDLTTGRSTKVLEKRQFGPSISPEGKYLAYWAQKSWWLYDVERETQTNLTVRLGRKFEDVDYDGPQAETPPESFPIWIADDAAVVLFDKYDAFLVRLGPAGPTPATPITNGASEKLMHRLVDVGFYERGIRMQDPWYFRVVSETTKATGYYRRETDGSGKVLSLDNMNVSSLRRAKDVPRMLFVMGSFEKSPNVYLTNELFTEAKPLTNTNPQQANFHWGKAELISFRPTVKGKRANKLEPRFENLQAVLIYPADYQPGRLYPMITYVYERLSQNLHNYSVPSQFNPYNPQVWSQNGYFVLMPDIAYRTNDPGGSAVDCLVPAVQAAIAKNLGINPDKVGLVGHSWGGYQTAYVPTQTKVFKAAVAGAPLTELTSMYNSFYWNVGITNQVIFESSQGRFSGPWWEHGELMQAYIENSPVWNARNLEAPMLIAFGDQDGAVDWHQGQYYYNTLRRMGKPVVMLVYPGENHGLAKKSNQKDYAQRVLHWFDVHLKNMPAEPWVREGLPAVKKP